jgi:hypothetical protein
MPFGFKNATPYFYKNYVKGFQGLGKQNPKGVR